MRLAVDGRELFNPFGMGRLLLLTLRGLRQLYPEVEISVFLNRDISFLVPLFGSVVEDEKLHFYSCPLSLSSLIWENYFLKPNLTKSKFDLFYLPHNYLGILSLEVPFVSLICDVIPLLFPEFYLDVEDFILGTKQAAKLSQKIITISQCSKRDIQQHLGVRAEKIEVIYPSIGDFFISQKNNKENEKVLNKLGLEKPYFLNIGGFNPRKNLYFLLTAFARYLRETADKIKLVIVSPKTYSILEKPFREKVKELNISKQVIFLGTVSDIELLTLYQEAEALVFPSLYEGFGLPVAEALACGTPVLASSGSSLEEAANNQALFFPPKNEEALIAGLKKVRLREPIIQKQIEAGQTWARSLTKERWVRKLYQVFEETMQSDRN